MRKIIWLVIAAFVFSSFAIGQERTLKLTIDDIFHPKKAKRFSGKPTFGLRWTKDGTGFVRAERTPTGLKVIHANVRTGATKTFYDGVKVGAALRNAGVSDEAATRMGRGFALAHSETTNSFLLNSGKDLYVYNASSSTAKRVTNGDDKELEADFSPDGTMVSFVRNNDLYVVEVASGKEHRITFDGSKHTLNGYLAWVYEEELYGRGQNRGYWWSPDSKHITFLKTDDSMVPMFVLADDTVTDQNIEDVGYPQAGDPNPTVKLGLVDLGRAKEFTGAAGKKASSIIDKIKEQAGKVGIKIPGNSPVSNPSIKFVDLSKYSPKNFLISRVDWSPDSKNVIFQGQNREQTYLDLNSVDLSTGKFKTLFRETTGAWIASPGNPYWLNDGSFVWRSPKSGWHHLYHYAANGKLIRQITNGNWEVRRFYGVDQKTGNVFFSGTKDSHIGPQIYRTRLSGGVVIPLTRRAGSHRANFNPTFTHFVDTWSDINTPPQTRLHRWNGDVEKVINENIVGELLGSYGVQRPEFMKVRNRDGFQMEAYMIKPPNFNRSKKYPVLTFVYGGPHAPQVRNSWGGRRYMYHQMLAQRGYIIFVIDPRSASGKGEKETWTAYKRLGVTEQLDIEDGMRFLKRLPYVDANRLGIWGWSYGGFMTLFSMTHSKSFKAGISVAPVSDWALYDSIYTERYMLTPKNNPEGYARMDLNAKAKDLHGKLMIVHGMMDNNVHMQNTTKFIYELQKAGIQFDMMAYPTQRHSIRNALQTYHLYTKMANFIQKNL